MIDKPLNNSGRMVESLLWIKTANTGWIINSSHYVISLQYYAQQFFTVIIIIIQLQSRQLQSSYILCDLGPDWLYGLGQMLFPYPLIGILCGTGRRNAGSQDVIFHALAHQGHMFLPVWVAKDVSKKFQLLGSGIVYVMV